MKCNIYGKEISLSESFEADCILLSNPPIKVYICEECYAKKHIHNIKKETTMNENLLKQSAVNPDLVIIDLKDKAIYYNNQTTNFINVIDALIVYKPIETKTIRVKFFITMDEV